MKKNFLGLTTIIILLLIVITLGMMVYTSINISSQPNHDKPSSNESTNNTENQEPTAVPEQSKDVNDMFGKYYIRAEEIMANMTLEEKVGQVFYARCPDGGQIEEIKSLHPAGYILFGRDFKNKTTSQVARNIESYQEASKIPLLIGVDEEGGGVTRVTIATDIPTHRFLSPQTLFAKGGMEAIKQDVKEKSDLLHQIGINNNLAPVADVSTDTSDFIFERSFGKEATQTAIYIKEVVRAMNDNKMATTLKHFPGYGNNVDTHTGIAYDKRSYESFINSDFIPFQAGIEEKVPSILVSHNIVECMDATVPASISPKVHEILRKELNFTGIIMTDDMAMDGIKTYMSLEDAAISAIEAGNDLIITSHLKLQRNAVLDAVKNKTIQESTLDKAVRRVLAWKISMGILE